MGLGKHREQILTALRTGCRTPLRDEDAAWRAVERIASTVADDTEPSADRKFRIDRYVYGLGLLYAYQTGAMPGFTNSESETRFERFVAAIPLAAEWKVTRNLIKACIRRIDAKRNPEFARDLENKGRENAAE